MPATARHLEKEDNRQVDVQLTTAFEKEHLK